MTAGTAPETARAFVARPPVARPWVQATAVAVGWAAVASVGGFGANLTPEGAAAAAGLALVAANIGFDLPPGLRPFVAPALVVAGACTGVIVSGPALGGGPAIVAYVSGALLALAAATAPRQAAVLALVPALALTVRGAPGVNTILGVGMAAVAFAIAVVLVVTSGEQRPHRDAPWGAAPVAVGIALLPFPLLDSPARLVLAAAVVAVAANHPAALVALGPGVAVGTELLLVRGVPAREVGTGILAALALGVAALAAAREIEVHGLPTSPRHVPEGTWPAAAAGLWLVLAPQTWGWTSRTIPTVLVLDGYVAGTTRAVAAGLLAVAVAGVVGARRRAGQRPVPATVVGAPGPAQPR